MKLITQENLPHAVQSSLHQAGCSSDDFPDLAIRLLMSRAIQLSPNPARLPMGVVREGMSQWLVVNPNKNSGTRVARNNMNPVGVTAAVLSVASNEVDLTSCMAVVVAIAAACSSKLTKDQAALLVALKRLEESQQIRSALAVSIKMTRMLERSVTPEEALAVVAQLQGVGVPFTVGPLPHQVIQCQEATTLFPDAGA